MAENKRVELTFRDHLIELLTRLRMVFLSLLITTIVVMIAPATLDFTNVTTSNPFYFTVAALVIRTLQDRFLPVGAQLLPMSPFAPIEVYMFVSVILGVFLSLPVISYELYKFLNPALHTHERKGATQFIIAFAGLFIFGFLLGFLFIVPTTMRTLLMFSGMLGLPAVYDFTAFFSLVGFSLLLCGMLFTFPIYLVLLVKVGILQTRYLTKNRKFLYGGLLILIAFLDPEPGVVTESLVFLPIVILTEVSIIIAKRIEKARQK